MAITGMKIHPAIGIARLGNSPDEFFIGPERLFEPPAPAGGFKDAACRVKRQAARFRVFAYHDDSSVTEMTADDADITWSVHVTNRKAVKRNPSVAAASMTIDPGLRQLVGANQREVFDTGQVDFPGQAAVTVPLGEARTNNRGRLLVLGGFGSSASPSGADITEFLDNAGWYDDTCDGPVTATVKVHASGDTFTADGAWVIAGPPSFAPQIENVITLYDTVEQMVVDQNWRSAPAAVSYSNHVYPILERARTTRWVSDVFGAHAWPDPVYDPADRQAIFNRLANPGGGGGNMPQLQSATLTEIQYEIMNQWAAGNFQQDWSGPPTASSAVTPSELDRAALQNCVGAAFYPGIEAGGIAATPITTPSNYVGSGDPMRLSHSAVTPGGITEFMALPWQADFKACGSQWWPVPRPNEVLAQATGTEVAWDRDVGSMREMVSKWHTLGFVVAQGSDYVEVDRCDSAFITLVTPHLNFQDVPQGPMGAPRKAALAIVFEVRSTGGQVTLDVLPGDRPAHLRLQLFQPSVTVGPTAGNDIATARLWLTYSTGPIGEQITDQVVVRESGGSESWTISITANTVARKVTATALVLDRSGSMDEDRGDGQSKHASLVDAASIFIDVALEGDGIGVSRYNQDAQILEAVTALGAVADPFDPGRQTLKNIIGGPDLTPSGATSIGDGIHEGRQILGAASTPYDVKALVVLTDGKENRERWIADVAAQVNEQTYAVGLGTPQNTSAPALQTLSGNHGGYLLLTGAIAGDNRFLLQKYFLQILAGISNADIVLDPDGTLIAGHDQQIPFRLTETDNALDVVLLTPDPTTVNFRLQTPNGLILEPWRASAEPNMAWSLSHGVSYYRLVLPAELIRARFDQAGTWQALLSIGRPRVANPAAETWAHDYTYRRIPPRSGPEFAEVAGERMGDQPPVSNRQRKLPYSLVVHTYSDISFRATLSQTSFEPGATITVIGTIASAGVPVNLGATVWADVTGPGGTISTLPMTEVEQARFSGSFTASLPGVYRCRVRASGRSPAGYPFTREQTQTAAVWAGGDRDADPATASGGPLAGWLQDRDARLCRLLDCLLENTVLRSEVAERLRQSGIDPAVLQRCLAEYCRTRQPDDDDDR